MNGNNPTPVRTAREISRREWENAARLFGGITLDAPYVSGPLGVGPVDGEVVLPTLEAYMSRQWVIPAGSEFQIGSTSDAEPEDEPEYIPEDKRPAKQRRANKRLYSKARAYYGKTYIITRAQMLLAVLISLGLILTLAASGALVMLYSLGLGKYI